MQEEMSEADHRIQLDGHTFILPHQLPPLPLPSSPIPSPPLDSLNDSTHSSSSAPTPGCAAPLYPYEAQPTPVSMPEHSTSLSEKQRGGETSPSCGNSLTVLLDTLTQPPGYGLWAHILALATVFLCLLFGAFTFIWWLLSAPALYSSLCDLIVSCFALAIALLVMWEEVDGLTFVSWLETLNLGQSHYGVRAVLYVILSIPLLLSWPTLLPAAALLMVAFLNSVAQTRHENFHQDMCGISTVLYDSLATDLLFDAGYGAIRSGVFTLYHLRAMNKVRPLVWLLLYLSVNAVLFAVMWMEWTSKVNDSQAMLDSGVVDERHTLTQWLTAAKAFGWLIDLNVALLILPVSRRLIRVLYHWSTYMGGGRFTKWVIQPLVRALPLDCHLTFHRLVALVVVLASIGHTTAHFVQFALRPDLSQQLVGGLWPYISGVLLCLLLLLICTGAVRRIQRANWSIFQRTHSLYLVLLVLVLTHGKGGVGPNFWKFLLFPAAVFLVDKLLQFIQTQREVLLLSVRTNGNVIVLEFDRVGALSGFHHAGDYYLLNCPTLSQQWHAFTISSAPSDQTVTMHIQTHGTGSFTTQLRDWLMMCSDPVVSLDGTTTQHNTEVASDVSLRNFSQRDVRTGQVIPGRSMGPDHKALLRVDGPYSTPSRNFDSAAVVHMVAGGIGITPALSAMQEIVFHLWSVPSRQTLVQHCYLTLALPYAELNSFHWLLHTLHAIQEQVVRLRQKRPDEMHDRSLRIQIYVTSVPSHVTREHPDFALFTDMQLMVHLQRPKWSDIITSHHMTHPGESVAVLVCAREELVHALTEECQRVNQQRKKPFMVFQELF